MVKVLSVVDSISAGAGKLVSVLNLFVAVLIVYEVVMRYGFNRPSLWGGEMIIFSCGLIYLIGGAWTMLDERHVRVELLYGKLSPKGRAIMDVITFFIFALFIGMLFWAASAYAWDSLKLRERAGSAFNPPIYPMKIAFAVGILLILLQGIAKFIRDLYFIVEGKRL